jgi:hypothetical protein
MYYIVFRCTEPLKKDKWKVVDCVDSYDEANEIYSQYLRKGVDYYDVKLLTEA